MSKCLSRFLLSEHVHDMLQLRKCLDSGIGVTLNLMYENCQDWIWEVEQSDLNSQSCCIAFEPSSRKVILISVVFPVIIISLVFWQGAGSDCPAHNWRQSTVSGVDKEQYKRLRRSSEVQDRIILNTPLSKTVSFLVHWILGICLMMMLLELMDGHFEQIRLPYFFLFLGMMIILKCRRENWLLRMVLLESALCGLSVCIRCLLQDCSL